MTVLAPSTAGLLRFRSLVERELGLRFDDAGMQNLERALVRRLGVKRQACDEYLDRLDADPNQEILALSADLTVGETYFLRHIEQFQALTRTALPDLLRTPGRTSPLRLLSAGCSTGEETYSLAIALRESGIGPDAAILGVDANPVSLAKARTGRYTDWSLRSVPLATQQRWFTTKGAVVVLDPAIRSAVHFERRNIAQNDPALWQPASFDVIFCRNVIMYFTPEVMAEVVGRISSSLIPGGYLFLGSAETVRGLSDDFEIRESHGTFYYRRLGGANQPASPSGARSIGAVLSPSPSPEATLSPGRVLAANPVVTPRPVLSVRPVPAPMPVAEPVSAENLLPVMDLLRRERFADALVAMDELTGSVDSDPELLLLRAALLTHSGHLPAAERACRRLLEIDARSAGAHVLLAMCREGEQDLPAAVEHCRTAITFDPDFAMPHVHLGRLARRMGDRGTAQRQYTQSTRLLPTETGHRILLFGGGFDREALIAQCRTQAAAVREER
ncbi:MAG TPA: CheR family methyltransferase [Kineosporiaceae bacterium]|nr:CheR family methyltransferase [Kineosporiaceae bacterium]